MIEAAQSSLGQITTLSAQTIYQGPIGFRERDVQAKMTRAMKAATDLEPFKGQSDLLPEGLLDGISSRCECITFIYEMFVLLRSDNLFHTMTSLFERSDHRLEAFLGRLDKVDLEFVLLSVCFERLLEAWCCMHDVA
jgi:hypothetical protein